MGTFSHCHVTYFWMVKLRCLVPGRSRTRWMRNPPGCLPGKKYFVIHFLSNRAWLKNRPTSLPPSFLSRKQYCSSHNATKMAGNPLDGSNPCHYRTLWAGFSHHYAVLTLTVWPSRSDMAVFIIFLKGKVTGFSKDSHRRVQYELKEMPWMEIKNKLFSDVADPWSAPNWWSLPNLSVFDASC